MVSVFLATAIAAFLAAIVTSIGIGVICYYAKWGKKYVNYFMYFAAGVLISVSLLHIIPKSFKLSPVLGPMFLFFGFLLLYILDKIIKFSEKRTKKKSLGIISATGIGIHSFIDGIIYSITFTVSIFTGALAALGMVLHEFPEGIITFLLLLKSGFKKKIASAYAFLAAAISTPIGMLVSWPFISKLSGEPLGSLLAFSAGALLYVGAVKLLPEAEKESRPYAWLVLFLGVLVAIGIILTKG